MNLIETMYVDYGPIIQEFSEENILNRYAALYKEALDFLDSLKLMEHIRIDETLLMHAVMDYFSDISRIKRFHHMKHLPEMKVLSYETCWLLRRKPLQILLPREKDDILAFINEKFVFTRLASFMVKDREHKSLSDASKKGFLNYLDTVYYSLKYRSLDPQMLELLLFSFKTGELIGRETS